MKGVKITAAVCAGLVFAAAAFFFGARGLYPWKYGAEISKYAAQYGFAPELIFAVVKTESGFDRFAVSGAGASGLMQLMPATAEFISEKEGFDGFKTGGLFDAETNICLGCAYLRYLADKFGDIRLALCAYNAGEGNVAAWLIDSRYSSAGKPLYKIPFKETERYYKKVVRAEKRYRMLY